MILRTVISVMLAVLVFQCGCATISYHRYMGTSYEPTREFRDFAENNRLYTGTLVSENAAYRGKECYHIQFEGVLEGNGRYLEIYLPRDGQADAAILETDKKLDGKKISFLIIERSCCADNYRELFDPIPMRETEKNPSLLFNYVKNKFGRSVSAADLPVIFCKLSFSNVFQYSVIYTVWETGAAGASYRWNSSLEQPYSNIEVGWGKRSRAVYVLSRAGYVFTALFDVATSPIQLIGVAVYFAMGGAVK
ncbi:MAG: hypothetical protein MUD12_15720 [Spirochaetes bacterium]|jgi:hypothetical protein|nr:hypothetical protein [Spirochaetota bacterium]